MTPTKIVNGIEYEWDIYPGWREDPNKKRIRLFNQIIPEVYRPPEHKSTEKTWQQYLNWYLTIYSDRVHCSGCLKDSLQSLIESPFSVSEYDYDDFTITKWGPDRIKIMMWLRDNFGMNLIQAKQAINTTPYKLQENKKKLNLKESFEKFQIEYEIEHYYEFFRSIS